MLNFTLTGIEFESNIEEELLAMYPDSRRATEEEDSQQGFDYVLGDNVYLDVASAPSTMSGKLHKVAQTLVRIHNHGIHGYKRNALLFKDQLRELLVDRCLSPTDAVKLGKEQAEWSLDKAKEVLDAGALVVHAFLTKHHPGYNPATTLRRR